LFILINNNLICYGKTYEAWLLDSLQPRGKNWLSLHLSCAFPFVVRILLKWFKVHFHDLKNKNSRLWHKKSVHSFASYDICYITAVKFTLFFSTDGDLVVPNKTQNNTFVYIENNGTVYDITKTIGSGVKDFKTARQVCQQKGGDLVSIMTLLKFQKASPLYKKIIFIYCANGSASLTF